MSSGWPSFAIGVAFTMCASRSGVRNLPSASVMIVPGSMALMRTWGAKSCARLRVIWFSAALAAP